MQITVKFVNHPKYAGAQYGSIVDTGGTRYPCPGPLIDHFRQGETYDVPIKTENWKDKDTGEKKPVMVIAAPPRGAIAAPAAPQSAPPSRAAASNGNGYPPKDDELITRLAILKSLIEAGMLKDGMSMDDIVAMAWETAPKLKKFPA